MENTFNVAITISKMRILFNVILKFSTNKLLINTKFEYVFNHELRSGSLVTIYRTG